MNPDPSIRRTDPGIRIRIRTKMSRIPNTGWQFKKLDFSGGTPRNLSTRMCVHVLYVVGQIFSADDGPINILYSLLFLFREVKHLPFYSWSYCTLMRAGLETVEWLSMILLASSSLTSCFSRALSGIGRTDTSGSDLLSA
jgi:hypothetical protein